MTSGTAPVPAHAHPARRLALYLGIAVLLLFLIPIAGYLALGVGAAVSWRNREARWVSVTLTAVAALCIGTALLFTPF